MQTKVINGYSGAKVFTATKAYDRDKLGDALTTWLTANPDVEVIDTVIRQSSDSQFHCLSMIVFFNRRESTGEAKAA